MIIDCHGHYTTAPQRFKDFRAAQLAWLDGPRSAPAPTVPDFSDEELAASVEGKQLAQQRARGTDLTLFSPRAAGMEHHVADAGITETWTSLCNDLVGRIVRLFPRNFIGVCQLPQIPGTSPTNCIDELERCVHELGFVGLNLNPDPSGGFWRERPLTDPWWFPLYEKMVELDVPAMIHVSKSCNDCFHTTGAHYINADTTAFMQLLTGDLFSRFPTLKLIIPHGGGAAPYHWGRYRGMAQDLGKPSLSEHLLGNLFFDTCVYHYPGIELLTRVIPADNILFASEMVGAVQGIDPETGHNYDDTKRYIDQLTELDPIAAAKIFEGNARRVFGRLDAQMRKQGILA